MIESKNSPVHYLCDRMKTLLGSPESWMALVLMTSCAQNGDGGLLRALNNKQDQSEIHDRVEKSGMSLGNVLNILWAAMKRGGADQRVTDDALVRISRGILLSPELFGLADDEFWSFLASFYMHKYRSESDSTLKHAAAIYLRQIRTHNAESLADREGIPSLKELTGYELENTVL